jgi:hypothetical protein
MAGRVAQMVEGLPSSETLSSNPSAKETKQTTNTSLQCKRLIQDRISKVKIHLLPTIWDQETMQLPLCINSHLHFSLRKPTSFPVKRVSLPLKSLQVMLGAGNQETGAAWFVQLAGSCVAPFILRSLQIYCPTLRSSHLSVSPFPPSPASDSSPLWSCGDCHEPQDTEKLGGHSLRAQRPRLLPCWEAVQRISLRPALKKALEGYSSI